MAILAFKRSIYFGEATPSKNLTADSTSYPQAGKMSQNLAVVTKQSEEFAISNTGSRNYPKSAMVRIRSRGEEAPNPGVSISGDDMNATSSCLYMRSSQRS